MTCIPSRPSIALRTLLAALSAIWVTVALADASSADIVAAARRQVGITVHYDPAYRSLAYPLGDLPADRGVCTDVVVRALRLARGIDLQKEVHLDISAHFESYPYRRYLPQRAPDSNIDHRRVPNLMQYFARRGLGQPLAAQANGYAPGDIVAWDLGGGILHIGIVSDRRLPGGIPLVIHNIGRGAREEDILFRYRIIGHYRLT
jgi:uncharacterized protein YijF (DUF1287 family)